MVVVEARRLLLSLLLPLLLRCSCRVFGVDVAIEFVVRGGDADEWRDGGRSHVRTHTAVKQLQRLSTRAGRRQRRVDCTCVGVCVSSK